MHDATLGAMGEKNYSGIVIELSPNTMYKLFFLLLITWVSYPI